MVASKKMKQQAFALAARREREERHAEVMRKHAEKRQRDADFDVHYGAWVEAGMVGPMPVHPDNTGPIDADLQRAADELGIDLR
jgi:hypothetical protein